MMTADAADQVVLFSGHMIDAPERAVERFPARLEAGVARAIAAELDALGAGTNDIGVCGAACGSDLLFASAALDRRMTLRIYLPFDEPTFIERSVATGGPRWIALYRRVIEAAAECVLAEDRCGPLKPGEDPFTRNNLLMLSEAQMIRARALRLLCVWDGERGDGPGGTYDLVKAVRARHGEVRRIDTRALLRAAGA
ncbi:hypothetical protein G3N95_30890 [Paraburkholderia sp. Tr-20389]|uniref:hypothetical protein n=1 Tax=Paraburkholderia sp. Tr-20389 TaxID=2703903 RepID=UPI00197EEACB|nr:hypothetical protein [Paraburkholderia sp. Tr-20389]MBN3757375.1 hypothetical protein [Paraburkholderia sp. Tr-20389]